MNVAETILPIKRIWSIAILVAVPTAIPISFFLSAVPWLIVVPILFGTIAIIILEFLPQSTVHKTRDPSYISIFAKILFAFFPNSRRIRVLAREHAFTFQRLPKRPVSFIEPSISFKENFNDTLMQMEKLLLLGAGGSGKSTFAVEFGRSYCASIDSPTKCRYPVYVQFSRSLSSQEFFDTILKAVSENVFSNYTWYRKWVTKRTIKTGGLLFIFDDLDYLNKRNYKELRRFIDRSSRNVFLCVMREKPINSTFLNDFATISIPEWSKDQVLKYIQARVSNRKSRRTLIEYLNKWGVLEQKRTPLEWEYIVNAHVQNTLFKLIYPKGTKGDFEYHIFESYIRIIFERLHINFDQAIKHIGSLALKLLSENRMHFKFNEERFKDLDQKYLTNDLFEKQGDEFAFVHGEQQIFFAGLYIGRFWHEAKNVLMDCNVETIIWNPVYNVALQFIQKENMEDLEKTFEYLSKHDDYDNQDEEGVATEHAVKNAISNG